MSMDELHKEFVFKTSRSGGAGGQNVNKVSTKVELLFAVQQSAFLSDRKKEIILSKLSNRISNDGVLHLQCDETRSQLQNKEIVIKRFFNILQEALKPVKKRRPTKPSRSSVRKRLDSKKKHGQKKDSRRFNPDKN